MEEAHMHVDSADFEQKSSAFVSWFQSVPGTRLSSKIELKDLRLQNAGRGVVALEAIAEDEELFAIPRPLVITTTTSNIPQSVLQPLTESGAWQPLIVTIIYEYLRKEDSPWYPYFQVLPTTFNTLMFWSDSELAELQSSAVTQKIGKQSAEGAWRESIVPIMNAHPSLFPTSGVQDRDQELIHLAHMAGSLIMAYAFDIDRDDEKQNQGNDSDAESFEEDDEDEPLKGMVPFADMLNANADRNNAKLFQEDDYLIMRSTKAIAAGKEIFNDYGPLPRSDLLRMYGYITDNYAQYDVVEFSLDMIEDVAGKKHGTPSQTWLKRKNQLDELGLLEDGYVIPRAGPNSKLEDLLSGELHMLLRALCADDSAKLPKPFPKEAITVKEAALLSAILTKRLSEYATMIEEDNVLLDQNVAEHRLYMAIQVRKGEKEILQDTIRLCQALIEQETASIAHSQKRKVEDNTSRSRKTARTNKR